LRCNYAISIRNQNPQSKSVENFKNLDSKYAKLGAKKRKKVLVEMGILGDFIFTFCVARVTL